MPVNPNFLERFLLLRLNKGPAPILDLFGAASFKAVNLALDMGIFDALVDEELSVSELAGRVDADEDAVRMLLSFLNAQGYVADGDGRYRNTRMTTKWLTSASETNMAPFLTYWNELAFPFWEDHLETAIRQGDPPRTIYEWFDEEPERWEVAQRGFRAMANIFVDEVTDKLDVPEGATRLLDVGGGHGLYAIELCREHPDLSATIFDNPEALAAARAEIAEAVVGDRVAVSGGDYWTDDLGTGYDVAFVFNIIHAHDAAENTRLFERVGEALEPGGRIAILDQLAGSARTPLGKAAIGWVGLTYLTTLEAETHPYEDVAEWLRASGFNDVSQSAVRRAGPGNTLIQATKV